MNDKNEKVIHVREEMYNNVNNTYTVVGILDSKKKTISYGVSRLNPMDNFSRKKGRQLAGYRAIKNPVLVEKMGEYKSKDDRIPKIDIYRLFRMRVEEFTFQFLPSVGYFDHVIGMECNNLSYIEKVIVGDELKQNSESREGQANPPVG